MAINSTPNLPEDQSIQGDNDLRIHGYTRLKFFNFKIWQFALLFLLLIGIALVLFPRRKMLINYYKDRGMLDEAISTLIDARSKSPEDPELLFISSDLYLADSDPDKAVTALEQYINKATNIRKGLLKLATLYEDTRNPKKAMNLWERIANLYPEDLDAWEKLITYYGYYGLMDKQMHAIIQHIQNEDKSIAAPKRKKPEPASPFANNPFLVAMKQEITNHIAIQNASQKFDPYRNELIRSLFMIRMDLMRSMESESDVSPDQDTALFRFMEKFVRAGLIDDGIRFAGLLDSKWNQGMRNRLTFIKILRWNRLDRQAIALLSRIYDANKENTNLLKDIVKIARENNDLETAIPIYTQLVQKDPDNIEKQEQLAELYVEAGNISKAYSLYKEIANKQKNNVRYIEKLFQLASYSDRKDVIKDAAGIGIELRPDDPAIQKQAAEMLLGIGDQKEAIKAYRNYLRLNPKDQKAQTLLAELYTWTDQPKKAYDIYKQMAIQSKGNKAAVDKMIEIAASTGSSDIIQDSVSLAARLRPQDETFKHKSAELLLVAGKEKEAIKKFKQYLALNPDDESARRQLIQLYQWTDQQDKAVDLLLQLSDKDPASFEKALTAGTILVEMGKVEDGVSYLKRASNIRPNNIELRKQLLIYYGWLGRDDSAIQELEFLHSVGKLPEEHRIRLAQTYLDRKEGGKALNLLKPLESQTPLPKEAGLMLTSAYELLGRLDAVASIYKRLAKENSDDPNLLADLGNRALWMQKTHMALEFFILALKKDSKQLQALKGSAQIYAWNNDPERAIERFEDYNRLNPDDYEVRYQLGELYFTNGREGDAFRQYRKALALMRQTKIINASK